MLTKIYNKIVLKDKVPKFTIKYLLNIFLVDPFILKTHLLFHINPLRTPQKKDITFAVR